MPAALSNPPYFATVKIRLFRHIKRAGVGAPAEHYFQKAVNGFE